MSQNRAIDTLRSLIPPFILLWADGLSGDFNDHPKAKTSAWPALIIGIIAIFFSLLAAGFGHPLYRELVNLVDLLPSFSSYIFVGLIAAGIYTLSQKHALYKAETKRFAISRVSSYEARVTLVFLLILGGVDAAMNLGGQLINTSIQRQNETEQVYSGAFQFSQQAKLDKLNAEIEQLNNPQGCEGHTACKKSCPYDGRGASHVPGGQLTSFGRAALKARMAKVETYEDIMAAELNNYNKVQAAQGGTAEIKDTGRSTVSYLWVVLLYILMYGASRLNANYTLNFEEACNALPNYELLVLEQEDTERRLNARKAKIKAQKQRIREHKDEVARLEAERNRKRRRSRRMQSSEQQKQEESKWQGSRRARRNQRPSPTRSQIPFDDERFYEEGQYYDDGGEYGYEVENVYQPVEEPELVHETEQGGRSSLGYPGTTEKDRYILELEQRLEAARAERSPEQKVRYSTVSNKNVRDERQSNVRPEQKRNNKSEQRKKGLNAARKVRVEQASLNRKEAVRLRKEGLSLQEIADRLGVGKSTVHGYLKKEGLTGKKK